jgi:exodeoxyribonuclease VII large subunit
MMEGRLPSLPGAVVDRARGRLDRYALALQQVSTRRIAPQMSRLEAIRSSLGVITNGVLQRRGNRLDALGQLLSALSPQATLRRGYSITRYEGHAVTDGKEIPAGAVIETTLASGKIISIKQ